ncbi:MAG: nitrous oxide reductase family maturation protein NosD [Planctomycetes bacterium]|nr:nitrous oxide reductase family maturation protein NosD [Planctomycetota bacterium]
MLGRTQRTSRGGLMLAIYAAILLAASALLPWWRMESRAPQYGMRVLWVDVYPGRIEGDVKEIDGLGHYVGIAPMGTMAPVERAVGPYALGFAVLCALALPFLRRGWLRTSIAALLIAVPGVFALDLWCWQQWAIDHLDPTAPMSNISGRIRSQLLGEYSVAQFHVHAMFEAGFWLTLAAAANALAFLWTEGVRAPRKVEVERAPRAAPAMAAAFALAPLVYGESLSVGPNEAFRSITEAVRAAAPGDVIDVRPGIYREHVVVDRALELRGASGAIIDGGGAGTVVLVSVAACTIRGFEVRGSGASLLEEDAGIKLLRASDCVVDENRVDDALFGIMAKSSPRATLRGNRVVGKDLPIPRQGDGIRLHDANGSLVEDNTVEKSRDLVIWQSNDCIARRNVVRGGRYGLHYMYCDDNLFEDNVFEDNQTGGAIMYSRRLVLRRNRFSGSRGPSAYGLLVKMGDDVVAEDNWFVDNSSGLFLEDSPSARNATCVFRRNVLAGNDVGVSMSSTSARVTFTENTLVANRRQVENLGRDRADLGTWSAAGRGNYWDDYVGFDADGDGTGDTPHRLEQFFEELTERWPAVALLRMGPASQALETAARAFPIVQPKPLIVDEHPLIHPPANSLAARDVARQPLLSLAGLVALSLSVVCIVRARSVGGLA